MPEIQAQRLEIDPHTQVEPCGPRDYNGMHTAQLDGYTKFVATDYHSNFIGMTYIVGQTSVAILDTLMLIFHCLSSPRSLISDRLHNMTNCETSDWCQAKDINRIISSPYNPASNEKAKSAMKIMKSLLKKLRGKLTAYSEALLIYHDIPVGPTATANEQLLPLNRAPCSESQQ